MECNPPSYHNLPSYYNGVYAPVSSSGHSGADSSRDYYSPKDDYRGRAFTATSYDYQASSQAHILPFSAQAEDDDDLHTPDPPSKRVHHGCLDFRGFLNLLMVTILILALLMLFAGYPILTALDHKGNDLQTLNGTSQIPDVPLQHLIDPDTPHNAYRWKSQTDNTKFDLVFSDEFEQEGRTFYPGDDPFFEAMDIYYGATNDYEWYSPEAANTTGGALQLTMTQVRQEGSAFNHRMNFLSSMMQSWNKLCFQGGYLEMSAKMPGTQEQRGFWPGLWTMGNLGRPGYLGSTDGMWPYSYQSCDWGTLPNQTNPEGTGPEQTINAHGTYSWQVGNKLSFLPGMRTSSCTCPGEDHPGPDVSVARSAPEVDLVEAQNANKVGMASQSLQVGPFDANYTWGFDNAKYFNATRNTYTGSAYQEAISGTAQIPGEGYVSAENSRFVTFGVEIEPDWNYDGNGYITWYLDGKKTWRAPSSVMGPNKYTQIGQRIVPVEPMSIILNLGISSGFQGVYFNELEFPAKMLIDYIRLYQRPGQHRLSCDPPDHPTAKYIADHADLYYNPNHTVFPTDQFKRPKNRLLEKC